MTTGYFDCSEYQKDIFVILLLPFAITTNALMIFRQKFGMIRKCVRPICALRSI